MENLEEMNVFLDIYELLWMNKEDIKTLNGPIMELK